MYESLRLRDAGPRRANMSVTYSTRTETPEALENWLIGQAGQSELKYSEMFLDATITEVQKPLNSVIVIQNFVLLRI